MEHKNPSFGPLWVFAAAALVAALGYAIEPARQNQGGTPAPTRTRVIPTLAAGGNSDSNNRMIAVTGIDVTGQSILYLVDTIDRQLAIYQASGGSPSTQGVKFVGARNIGFDLQLDGFNDKTTSEGRPLKHRDLERRFRDRERVEDEE